MLHTSIDTDVDTLSRVLNGIPDMSPAISDPARHEKILTYIESVCIQSPQTVAVLVNELNALAILSTCIPHPVDDRITSLALRFIGRLVFSAATQNTSNLKVFQMLIANHSTVLEFILDGFCRSVTEQHQVLTSGEIFGCLETFRLMLADADALRWISQKQQPIVPFITLSLCNQNLFIVHSCCRLIVAIVCIDDDKVQLDRCSILAAFSITGKIEDTFKSMSDARADSTSKLTVLEIVWLLAESNHSYAIQFIIQKNLVEICLDMLLDTDRLVQHRASDALKRLISFDSIDLSILFPACQAMGTSVWDHLVETVFFRMVDLQPSVKTCHTYFRLLEILARVVDNDDADHKIQTALQSIYKSLISNDFDQETSDQTNVDKNGNSISSIPFLDLCTAANQAIRKNCCLGTMQQQITNKQIVLHAFVTMLSCLDKSAVSSLMIVEWALGCINSAYALPKSVFLGLQILSRVLHFDDSLQARYNFVWSNIQDLFLSENAFKHNVQTHKAMLDVILFLVRSELIGTEIETCLKTWIHEIITTASWEIIDATLDCVIKVLSETPQKYDGKFLSNSLQLLSDIAGCLNHSSPFVRSTALKCLNTMSSIPLVRLQIDSNESLLQQILAIMTKDSEAFVRRSAIGLVSTLSKDAQYFQRLCSSGFLVHTVLDTCCFDEDLEVRVQAVLLLLAFFNSGDGINLLENPDEHFFFKLNADQLFLKMAQDPSRLVRLQVLDAFCHTSV
ncbi:hypothetical protein BDEG_24909 [Batrachochytrium dendrobatidis JEL423]|uniref:Uncharacterized protein n=2 Tax=Batrachochytrium dendrobatidis (strain JEL423) TaxID=403673 RepID=A0A177WMD0_BATDL|nr:hypothetical protein BDEG_24909 [Batrachochytrium dendrobatidis JEL423]